MKLKFYIIISFLFVFANAFGQQQYPFKIDVGISQNISATNSKLWVITDAQFRKTIETGILLDTCRVQNTLLKQQVDLLKQISQQKQDLIDTLKNDRDFYIQKNIECENDVESILTINDKFYRQRNIALVAGGATTVTAFIVGFVLGIK